MRIPGLSPLSHACRVHTSAKELSPILDNKDHSMFHNGFNCQWNLPQTQCQPDVWEVQNGELEMFSCGLEVRVRGLNLDSSILFRALSLTHHVTLDQSTELSGPTLLLWKENRTDDITDYLCSFRFQHVLKWGHCLFIPDKRPQFSIWPPSRLLFFFFLIF